MDKLCKCGCGEATRLSTKTNSKLGHIKGKPIDYINGHNGRGENSGRWKGGEYTRKDGYVFANCRSHPRVGPNCQMPKHILIAEAVLGKYLPLKSVVHHVDSNPSNNSTSNLVICENNNYHKLLHQRTRALQACGNAHWRKCRVCKKYDDPEIMYKERTSYRHHSCHWVKKICLN